MEEYKIATLGSHTALQILKGAKDEGFKTIVVCTKSSSDIYKLFNVADRMIEVPSFSDFQKIESELIKENAILIPHASFMAYMDNYVYDIKAKYYGNKNILRWEHDREKCRQWLKKAGIKVPKIFDKPEDIDRPVIVKFYGPRGGKGYFLVHNAEEFYEKIKDTSGNYVIQEYIIGVPVYAHFFQSRIDNRLEIMGFDKRYESNVDSIGRIAAKDQLNINLETSYDVIGNIPLVVRESLLPRIYQMGKSVVEVAKEIGGLYGPFCLEMVITPELDYYVFEISARIVAGTNPYINGSPYSDLMFNEPMSTGRRMAREIKKAIEQGRLDEIVN